VIEHISAKYALIFLGLPSAPGSVEIFQFIHSTVSDILTTEGHTARKNIERNNRYSRLKIVAVMR